MLGETSAGEILTQDGGLVPINCHQDTVHIDASPAGYGYLSSLKSTTGHHHDDQNDDVMSTCPTWIIDASRGQTIQLKMAAFGGKITSGLNNNHGPETENEISDLLKDAQSVECYEIGIASSPPPTSASAASQELASSTSSKHSGITFVCLFPGWGIACVSPKIRIS